ncbi:SDR family NAD(P)-dependent oxidoreductase [Cryptosporangium minutisporangium]|uniref:SDR family NAD(P)-dependent oxidoreductase n=1 Tax=Cryptosporangium minutisporangium TaxID=113569 RepID=A0ABP6SSC5_9ACTN
MKGTVALVTGASGGIGVATARRLASLGAAVALVARRRDRLDELVATIAADGGTALAVQADVANRNEAVSAVERTVASFGRLDTVVNNAGEKGLLYVTHAALLPVVRAAADSPRRVADLVNIGPTIAFSDAIRRQLVGQNVRVSVVGCGSPDDVAAAVLRLVSREPNGANPSDERPQRAAAPR